MSSQFLIPRTLSIIRDSKRVWKHPWWIIGRKRIEAREAYCEPSMLSVAMMLGWRVYWMGWRENWNQKIVCFISYLGFTLKSGLDTTMDSHIKVKLVDAENNYWHWWVNLSKGIVQITIWASKCLLFEEQPSGVTTSLQSGSEWHYELRVDHDGRNPHLGRRLIHQLQMPTWQANTCHNRRMKSITTEGGREKE